MPYEFKSPVRYSETDEYGQLSVEGLVNYFQDTSTFHSEELGIGYSYLKPQHRAWLLSSWQIVIDHMPHLCEYVTAATWGYEFKDFYGYRNFTMKDGTGKMAAWANSVWFMFDMERQVPVRVDQKSIDTYGTEPRYPMEYAPRKIRLPKGGETQPEFVIEKHHLDTNHHVNNGQYIGMAMEYMPAGFEIRQVRAEYRKQALLGDMVVPVLYKEEDKFMTALCDTAGKPYAVVELTGR